MPGFDVPDPFASIDPFGGGGRARRSSRAPRAAFRQHLPAEDFESIGKQALGAGASGLGYVLGSLDKPGQAVRGVLAGNGASSLAHLIPFSDTMGITGDADKVSGRDLTDIAGITDKNSKGWGAWGAGLAADIATDPLTYMTFGAKSALTPTGSALKKSGMLKGMDRQSLLKGFKATEPGLLAAGKTPSQVAHMIAQGKRVATQGMVDAASDAGKQIVPGEGLSSLARINIPFGPKINVGTGELAQKVASGFDKTGDWLRFGNPVGRSVGSLFDHSVGGAVDAITQRGHAKYGQPAKEALEAQGRKGHADLLERLTPLIDEGVYPERDITDAVRSMAEGTDFMVNHALAGKVQPAAMSVQQEVSKQLMDAQRIGLPVKNLMDKFANYVPRQSIDINHKDLQLGGLKDTNSFFPVASGSNIAREEVLRDIPGGTARLNDWFSRFSGAAKADIPTNIAAIEKDMLADFTASGRQAGPNTLSDIAAKADAVGNRIAAASPKHLQVGNVPGLPFFSPDISADMAKRASQHAKTMAAARTAIGTIGDSARGFVNDGSMIPVHSLIKRLGLTNKGFNKDTGDLAHGALVQVYKALAPKGAANVDTLANLSNKQIAKRVGQFGVPNEQAAQILKQYAKWQAPEQTKSALSALDSFTNAFKALAYPIWLPSHVRNAMTAGLNNLTRGTGLGDYMDQFKVMTGRGGRALDNVSGAFTNLPPAERAAAIRKAQYASAGIFGGHGATDDIAGNARDALENLAAGTGPGRYTPVVPGAPSGSGNLARDSYDTVVKQGLFGSLKSTGQTALNAAKDPLAFAPWNWGSGRASNVFSPLSIRGVGGATTDALPAVAAGRKVGTSIENFFRGAQWLREVKNGMTPEMAAGEINKLHFNYGDLSDFESNVMRRLVPFYTFTRKNLPLQAQTIASRPGLFNAQYKPFHQKTPGEDGYVPKYMASGVSIPLGPEVDGKRQYVSKLGLPAEEALERLHFQNGLPDLRATALDYMGAMNPIIKAPLEQLFNTQFHTQRKLSDLQAPQAASAIGRLFGEDNPQVLSQILANSPLSRFVTSADKMMDPRKSIAQKAVNMLTGVRITDVDADKQRAIEFRNELEKLMEGHRSLSKYSRYYVKPGNTEKLTPEEIQYMRAYSQLGDQGRAYAKKKRAEIGIKQ